MARRKSWSEMSPRSRVFVVLGGVVELLLTSIALNDLRQRDPRSVRGPRWLWGLACLIQPVGPLAYLLIGRIDADS